MKVFVIILLCVAGLWIILDFIFSRLTLTTYNLHSDKIKNDVKIAFVSDFHNGKNGKKLLKMIKSQSPDFVVLGGDLVDRHTGKRRAYSFVKKLAKEYKVYFSPGNHEYFLKDTQQIFEDLKEMGITVLEDEHVQVEVNGTKLDICGIYDPNKDSEKSAKTQLSRMDMLSDKNAYRILLAHFPKFAKNYARRRFDLVLSGHEHGGIVRMPLSRRGLFGHSGFHPIYTGGYYQVRHTAMIVSRGAGYLHYNYVIPRLFNNPELVMIVISK